jgi:hypothetical protein
MESVWYHMDLRPATKVLPVVFTTYRQDIKPVDEETLSPPPNPRHADI